MRTKNKRHRLAEWCKGLPIGNHSKRFPQSANLVPQVLHRFRIDHLTQTADTIHNKYYFSANSVDFPKIINHHCSPIQLNYE